MLNKLALALCSSFSLTNGSALIAGESVETTPRVGDWIQAEWFDDVVKIPLTINLNTVWYANLIIGEEDDEATGGYCLFDNNSPRSVVYPTK